MNAARRAPLAALLTVFVALEAPRLVLGTVHWDDRLPPLSITALVKVFVWLPLCLASLYIAHRMPPRAAAAELGLRASAARGLGFGLLSSLPMAIVLAARWRPEFVPARIAASAVIGPFSEEVLFRGYLFGQMYRRARWGFLASVLASALLFGLVHLVNVGAARPSLLLGEVAVTAAGGALFAWLFIRWGDNLWVPIGLHAFMNLWWELFGVESRAATAQAGATAVGDTAANVARAACVALAIGVTLVRTERIRRREPVRTG